MSSNPPLDPRVGAVAYVDAERKAFVRWLLTAVARAAALEASSGGLPLIEVLPEQAGRGWMRTYTFYFAGRHAQVAGVEALSVRVLVLRGGDGQLPRLACDIRAHDPTAGALIALLLTDLCAAWPEARLVPQSPTVRDVFEVRSRSEPDSPEARTSARQRATNARDAWLRTDGRRPPLDLAAFGLPPDVPPHVVTLLHELTSKERDFIHLWRDRSLTADDIGRILSLSKSTVYNKSIKLRARFPTPWGDIIVPHRNVSFTASMALQSDMPPAGDELR